MAAAGAGVWLGFTDVITEGQFIGADGCGIVPSDDPAWADGEPDDYLNEDFAVLSPLSWPDAGWHDMSHGPHGPPGESILPLCQMLHCYQPDCN